jgi:hypothetical protein
MASLAADQACAVEHGGIPDLDLAAVEELRSHGIEARALPTMGVEASGIDLRSMNKSHPALSTLQSMCADRGFLGELKILIVAFCLVSFY